MKQACRKVKEPCQRLNLSYKRINLTNLYEFSKLFFLTISELFHHMSGALKDRFGQAKPKIEVH